MTYNQFKEILSDIDATWQEIPFIIFHGVHGDRIWVQVGTKRKCTDTGEIDIGKGGKVYISEHATADEIVKKIFGLCMAYVEHEMRECFYYKNKRIFGPHISLEALMLASDHVTGRNEVERPWPYNLIGTLIYVEDNAKVSGGWGVITEFINNTTVDSNNKNKWMFKLNDVLGVMFNLNHTLELQEELKIKFQEKKAVNV